MPFWPRPDPRPPARLGPGRRAAARLRVLDRVARLAALAPRYDVTLIQRVLLPAPLQRLLARRARRLVFDVDDAIAATHAGMTDAETWAHRAGPRYAGMLGASSAVFVATPTLAAEARRHAARVVELASPVDCDRYRPAARVENREVVVGWIGSPATSIYLHAVLPACRRLAARFPHVRFEAVGAGTEADLRPFRVLPWSLDSELERLRRFDIGIMPLSDDEWSRGKAGYKLLQYMACGIASVASPVGVNVELLAGEARGLLAGDEAGWERALGVLVEDGAQRRRLAGAGTEFVRREYSLAVWAPRYHAALDTVAAAS